MQRPGRRYFASAIIDQATSAFDGDVLGHVGGDSITAANMPSWYYAPPRLSRFWCIELHLDLDGILRRAHLLRLDKLSYDIHMVAEEMLQRGMIDVEAPGSVRVGSAAH
jgi:hypothetical protein